MASVQPAVRHINQKIPSRTSLAEVILTIIEKIIILEPRIDPVQLLNCLSVLLSPHGGIKSTDEVQRLASLMTKFSKKLVSKCIYIQILKCTETELLGLFMGSGGWRLVHTWLTESIVAKNLPLVRELLELLLLCPVDIERLKTNNCPKLVKELSKDGNHFAIRALASKLVEQWLKTVKGDHVTPIQIAHIRQIVSDAHREINCNTNSKIEHCLNSESFDKSVNTENKPLIESIAECVTNETDENVSKAGDEAKKEPESVLPVLKISVKDSLQVVTQVDETEIKLCTDLEKDKSKENKKSKEKSQDKDKNKSKSSNSSKHSSKSHSLSIEKEKCQKSSSSRHSSSSSNKDKEKSKDKERHSSAHSSKSKSDSNRKSSSSSSSKSKESRYTSEKDKNKDRIKETKSGKSDDKQSKSVDKEKLPHSIHKLGKIPKLNEVKKEKPSISIEVRKPDEPKPKTVKTFHSKFRKHGLEEEVKPPPSRAALLIKKTAPILPPAIPVPKRPSPVHSDLPPEKKPKTIEPVEKPGSIKLIPPKPKPVMLLESDMFMDALNASATPKKEPKKRKRRTSGSKDGIAVNDGSPPNTPIATSPGSESKSIPPRFYQDTLDNDEAKDKCSNKGENTEASNSTSKEDDSMDTSQPHTLTVNGLKGVLCYHKRKGPKKTIKWKPDSELEQVQYFELDETERVNVTKTFTDMKHLERIHEREAFQKARNLSTDDVMEERTNWRSLILLDCEGQIAVEYGKNSKEKEIQAIRQKGTLQPLYFHKSMIPDSPLEPEAETHLYNEPTIIPLEDVTGNQDNVSDFRNMPWPEPKGNAPPASSSGSNIPNMFPTNISQFPGGFPPGQFPGMSGFQPPNMVPPDWPNSVAPHMMTNGMAGPMTPAALAPGGIHPGMIVAPENMIMNPDMFGGANSMFPVSSEGFNMQQNMFTMDFNMAGPQGPLGSDGFGPGNFRGVMRGRGAGGHWRGKNSSNWEGPPRGRGGHSRGGRKAVCIYFQRKGSCRQGDNCSFLHPGVNCPY